MSIKGKQALLTALKVFTAIGIALLIALVFVVLARIASSQKQARSDTNGSTARIENDLNCLGRFFSQTDRQNLKIEDLNSCTIVDTTTGNTTVLPGPPGDTAKPSAAASESSTTSVVAPGTPQTNPTTPPAPISSPPDPTLLKQLTNTVTNVPTDLTKAIGAL